MKIAAVLIVKNEEEMLARCLDSVKEFDEIIVCDTGSEDKTVEVAKKYTDKVYTDYEWEDSFCKARNHALSKVPDNIDWILSIDADEYLVQTYDQVKIVAQQAKEKAVNVNVTSESTGAIHKFPRLFKRDPEVFWVNDIHNLLNLNPKEYSDIEIIYGYSPAHKKDPDRAMRILMKSIMDDPKKVREKYYLAREYYYRHWWEKAIDMFDEYIKESNFRGEIADAYLTKARCLWQLKKGEEARVACMYAIMTNPDFKEALLFMSEMNYEPRKSKWAQYAELARNQDVLFVRTGSQKKAEYYDKLFEKDSDMSRYENIYKKIGEIVGDKSVLDVGCGLAELSGYVENYRGFDIAQKTVEKKQEEGLDVWVGDALEEENYKKADYYTILEVLEHIEKDKEVLELITEGQKILFSVPSFEDPSHVRTFDKDFLKERYKGIIDIKEIAEFVWDKENKRWYESEELTKPFILLVEAKKL